MILENWDEEAKQIVRNFTSVERDRLDAIIAMDFMVRSMNDESAYFTWIYVVPDCANEYDYIGLAENDKETGTNELFDEAVELFKKLWRRYANEKGGLYIGDKVY